MISVIKTVKTFYRGFRSVTDIKTLLSQTQTITNFINLTTLSDRMQNTWEKDWV